MVQNLAQTCHGFAAGMVKFCQRMGWGMLAAVLDHMRDRLEAGARADLLEMAQVAYVKSWTARVLRENGFRSVRALAEADPKDLVPVLMMVGMPSLKSSLRMPADIIRQTHARRKNISRIPSRRRGTPPSCSPKRRSLSRRQISSGVCPVYRPSLLTTLLSMLSTMLTNTVTLQNARCR